MKFSRNPVSGQMEIYTDDGVYMGIMSTFGDSFIEDGQVAEDGGPGSGNFGHKGRPGHVGGSGEGGGKQYRGGRSDIGYYGSRKDWLNGLTGPDQHKAARFVAKAKSELRSKLRAKQEIMSIPIPDDQKQELIKRGDLVKIDEHMTPEEFIMKAGTTEDREELINHVQGARQWNETANRLIKENWEDNDKKLASALADKYGRAFVGGSELPDDSHITEWDKEDRECWYDLKAKAMDIPTSGKEAPDELQYAAGIKERPAPPEPEQPTEPEQPPETPAQGPDYSWYEQHMQSTSGSNMEYYTAVAAGERVGYMEKWDEQRFAKTNQKLVDTLEYGKMSPNQVAYYGTIAVAGMRSAAMGGQFAWNYDTKVPKEMADRLTDSEKAQVVSLMNQLDPGFVYKYENFDDLTMKDFRTVEAEIKHMTPRSNEAQQPIKDYLKLQEKMICGCVPTSQEARAAQAEQARAAQAQQAQQAEQQRLAGLNTPEAQRERTEAAEKRKAREEGKTGSRPDSEFAKSVGKDLYDGCTAAVDKCQNRDAQVAWDVYHGDIHVNDTTGGSFYRPSNGEVTLNKARVLNGDKIHEPFETAFHEVGHAIDHAAGAKFGYGDKHLTEVWRNGLFCDTIEKEAKKLIDKIGDEGKKLFEAGKDNPDSDFLHKFYEVGKGDMWEISSGRKAPKWTVGTKRQYVKQWLDSQDDETHGGICDLIQGATRSQIKPHIGHQLSYYKGTDARGNMATEVFANLYGSLMTNKGNHETMKKYFPETVKLFNEMLSEISERG